MPHFTHTRILAPVDGQSCDISKSSLLSPTTKKVAPVSLPPFPPPTSLCDDTSQLYLAASDLNSSHGSDSDSDASLLSVSSALSSSHSHYSVASHSSEKSKDGNVGMNKLKQTVKLVKRKRRKSLNNDLSFDNASQRRTYFGDPSHRQAIQFGPKVCRDYIYMYISCKI